MNEIWILGATGRLGGGIAAELSARGISPVLVGRDANRLKEVAAKLGGGPRVEVAASLDALPARLAQSRPAVVVNTIGPFSETAVPIVRGCPPGTHYLDLSNELSSARALLGLHSDAVVAGQCVVSSAGFGVLGTESVVLSLCAGEPAPQRVRVDAIASVEVKDAAAKFGAALAASVVDTLASGGRRYENGRLVRARFGAEPEQLTLPDGSDAETACVPAAELEAACRASGAPFVISASAEVPGGRAMRAILPAAGALMKLPTLRNAAKRRLANTTVPARADRREFSWAHARVEWRDGHAREGWLRAGDGQDFTVRVAVEVAVRLQRGESRPGAYTPGALFGPELAVAAGGTFLLG